MPDIQHKNSAFLHINDRESKKHGGTGKSQILAIEDIQPEYPTSDIARLRFRTDYGDTACSGFAHVARSKSRDLNALSWGRECWKAKAAAEAFVTAADAAAETAAETAAEVAVEAAIEAAETIRSNPQTNRQNSP